MQKLFSLLSIAILLAGCATPRQMALLSGDGADVLLPIAPEYLIEPGDMLQITYSSTNPDAIAQYNSAGNLFIVGQDGTIDAPVIGKIQLANKTVKEATDILTTLAGANVKQPLVIVSITNAMVSILGEVARPQTISASQPITLLRAIAQVGGLTKNARCKDIQVRRCEKGIIRTYHVNLLTDELFNSPCYYLQKGDVVYVSPLHVQ